MGSRVDGAHLERLAIGRHSDSRRCPSVSDDCRISAGRSWLSVLILPKNDTRARARRELPDRYIVACIDGKPAPGNRCVSIPPMRTQQNRASRVLRQLALVFVQLRQSVRDPPQLSWQRTISGVLDAGPQTITEPVVTSIHALHVARVQPHNRTGACEMSVRRCVRDGCPDGCEGSHTSLDIENQATTNRSLATARCALIVSSHSVRTSHPRDRITSM